VINGKNDGGNGDKSAKDINHCIGGSEMNMGVKQTVRRYNVIEESSTGSLVMWSDYAKLMDEMIVMQAALVATEFKYRRQMWMSHGHGSIYGDDGEMQCIECRDYGTTDYKRDPLDKVEDAFHRACMARLEKAMQRAKET